MPTLRSVTFLLGALAMLLTGAAHAQAVTDGQKEQALRLIDAIHVTDPFADAPIKDALVIESQIVVAYPNLADRINDIVQEEALNLADRYRAFKGEAALIYAKAFTEEELKKLADFFSTDVGQKMLNEQEIMFREVGRAAEIWRDGFRKDLAAAVQKRVEDIVGADRAAQSEGASTTQTPGEEPAEQPAN
ncbi:hypothetical protein B7H23_09045 [Notoacmeibacter marinus]|uniref:DUF2059 domain-containing protein n=1 Tax=Notoacmeibacter marinus TaxID=1876515 RepID=A0A231UWU6_9HYPH|nr:DUF2059 domain-containing protein [Notoacmeibacter marinus]OXT00291.1 hypothetical protein B7H23_09045 [Notoacmeibacter marinus]